MPKSIKLNFVYNVLLNISSVIFPLITAPYVARVLNPDGLGLFNFANTYANYFALVAALGIPTYGVREVAKRRDDKEALNKLLSEIFTINVVSSILVSVVFLISLLSIGQLRSNLWFFVLAGMVIYTRPFNTEWYYQGMEEFGFITMRSLLIKVAGVLCLFLLVHTSEDVTIYLSIAVSTSILNQFWNYIMLLKHGHRPKLVLTGLNQHIKPLLLLFSSSIAISIYTVLDTIMLGFISSYSEVAYYNNATNISRSFLAIVTSLSIVAMPRLSYYMQNGEWGQINILMRKSLGIVSFLAIPITCGIVAIAPIFVPLFFGNAFVGTIVPLQIMAFVVVAIGFNNLTGVQVLVGLGHDKLFLYSVLVGTFSNFTLNCFLIPLLGASGAALASVIAETLILFVTTYFVYRKTPIRFSGSIDIIKSIIGGCLLVATSYMVSYFVQGWMYVFVYIILGIVVYFLSQMLMRSYSMALFKEILIKKFKK